MKILVMTDMEGVAGVLNHDDWVVPEGRFYEKGMRLLTEEVNAAVDGLYAGGASEVLVVDGHGAGGIDPELLDERVRLQQGPGEKKHLWGLDKSFNGIAWVGQHAKAGTDYSHLSHTRWFNRADVRLNGISIGEYGMLACGAMELAVPCILACGEEALCREAESLTPGVVTVSVKEGLLPDGLDKADTATYSKAKLSAVHLSPRRARALIREGALSAIRMLREDPETFRFPDISPPYVLTTRYRKEGDKAPRETSTMHAHSIIALMNMG